MNRSKIVIFGSARQDGDTKKALELVLDGITHDFIDLSTQDIAFFDYADRLHEDDFLSVIEKMIQYDDIILATPVYWYAASAQMKRFIDRWADLLGTRKDLGVRLAGKNLFVICSYGTEYHLGCSSFEAPLQLTADYMNMNYGGCFYYFSGNPPKSDNAKVTEFRNRLQSSEITGARIVGKKVALRMATLNDRRNLFEWMYCSDASKSMWGAPLFPEKNLKTWEDFKSSWELFYFQRPLTGRGHVFVIERDGEDVGGIAFHKPDQKNRSEIDIWLRSEKDCGRGTGRDAIDALCKQIHRQFGIPFFWAMPSARNKRSIATFEKTGFKRLPLSSDEGKQEFGFQDYYDSVYVMRDMSY